MTPADLIVHSGRLWDSADLPGQEAVAVRAGRILATGSDAEILPYASEGTRIFDAGGRRVIPGLIDSHMHMVRAGLRWGHDVRWHDLGSLDEGLEAISAAAASREPDEWIGVLGGWHPSQFVEGRPPSRAELDQVAPDNPVFVQRNYIEAFLNTRALEEMGWLDRMPDRPTALAALREELAPVAFDEQVEATRSLLRHLNGFGLTGCIDAGGFGMAPSSYHAVEELYQRGERGFRLRLLVGAGRAGDEFRQLEQWMAGVVPGEGDEFLGHLGAGEVLLFGAHDMEGLDRRDISAHIPDLASFSEHLARAGWPVHVHAIRDASVSAILDAWEQVAGSRDLARLRYTITHADEIGEANLARVSDMGLALTVQNGMAFRGGDAAKTWDEKAARRAPPLRAMLDLGIPVGAGTDATVVSSPNPWRCIWWMVNSDRDPEQRLTRDEALRLYTAGSAWFSFEEDSRGNLRPGSHADLAVLSADPLTIPDDQLPLVDSYLTIVGGEIVHPAEPIGLGP